MELRHKTVVITGAGSGIGAALARRFAAEQPRGIVLADLDAASAERVAEELRAQRVEVLPRRTDAGDPAAVAELVAAAEHAFGPVDVVCSNAGLAAGQGIFADDELWQRSWDVNVMAHVHLAKAVLPGMAARHSGAFLVTASAAGLLGLPGDAPYTVTKHAAVGLAEWLAATYRRAGVLVSVLCPLGVRTPMLMQGLAAGHPSARAVAEYGPLVEADDVAAVTLRGLAEDRFMILPHPVVAELHAKKASDPDAWITEQSGATVGARS